MRRGPPFRLLAPPLASLGCLDGAVVAGFADADEVVGVPKQAWAAAMAYLVVGYQLGCVVVHATAARPLAGEQIAQQDRPAQRIPALEAVPFAPWLCG